MKDLRKVIPLGLAFAPFLAMAADVQSLIRDVSNIINMLVPLLIGAAVVYFLYGIIKYVTAGGEEDKRTEARNVMIYGIIGLFVMVAVWGLVGILVNTFLGGTTGSAYPTPQLPR